MSWIRKYAMDVRSASEPSSDYPSPAARVTFRHGGLRGEYGPERCRLVRVDRVPWGGVNLGERVPRDERGEPSCDGQ